MNRPDRIPCTERLPFGVSFSLEPWEWTEKNMWMNNDMKNMRNHEDFIMAAWGCHEDLSNLLSWDTSCVVINNPNQAMVILKDYTHPIGFWILSAGSPRLPQVYGSCYPPLYSSHCLRLDAPMQVQGGKKKVNIQVTYGQNDQSSIIMLNHA